MEEYAPHLVNENSNEQSIIVERIGSTGLKFIKEGAGEPVGRFQQEGGHSSAIGTGDSGECSNGLGGYRGNKETWRPRAESCEEFIFVPVVMPFYT